MEPCSPSFQWEVQLVGLVCIIAMGTSLIYIDATMTVVTVMVSSRIIMMPITSPHWWLGHPLRVSSLHLLLLLLMLLSLKLLDQLM